MNCPSADKLSQYVDELLDEREHQALKMHINTCENCKRVIQLYENEALFIKDTLQTPDLPADFDAQILAQVNPYKKKRPLWFKPMNIAASSILAFGLLAAVTPTVADYVKSVFSTDEVDLGLQEAQRLGFVEQLQLSQTHNGITVTIDEVMVDTKRIGIIYHATNKRGKPIYPSVWDFERPLNYYFLSKSGEKIEQVSGGASNTNEHYGYLEFETPKLTEDLTLYWDIDQVGKKKGQWSFEIPIPIEKALPHLKTINLQQTITTNDTEITLDKMNFTPSSATLNYEIKRLEPLPKDKRLRSEPGFNMAFTITSETGEILTTNHTYQEYKGEMGTPALTASGGSDTGEMWQWEAVFSTISAEKPMLNIIGVEKVLYVNEDLTFTPNELDDKATLSIEGYPVQVASVKQKKQEPRTEIELAYDKNLPFHLEQWVLVDEAGMEYFINGREENKLILLNAIDLNQSYTLTLLTTRKFETLAQPIQISLYE